ncbi:MAG: glycosyltransferase family 4 protein [Firmicutes bacterium]|nr:glycosyltransferase family 4 protein [Bacillota bacterium]
MNDVSQLTRPKVLIVAHEFPPIGGVSVQRPYKFTQYLPEFGWDPVILTQDALYSATWDESLLAWLEEKQIPVYRAKNPMMKAQSWLHRRRQKQSTHSAQADQGASPLAKRAVGTSQPAGATSARSLLRGTLQRQARRVRQALLIPDDAILWLPAAISEGLRAIKEHHVSAIYATSPPESAQLVAAILSEKTGIPLVADFRDPWIGNLHRSEKGARHRIESDLEAFVFSRAGRVTTVTESFRATFAARYPRYAYKLSVISNGFDSRDLRIPEKATNDDQMVIYYGGILYEKRSPETFLRGLHTALRQGLLPRDKVLVRFAGVFDYPGKSANRELVTALGLEDVVDLVGYVPHASHAALMAHADLLLVIGDQAPGASAYVPAKVYEYLGVGKPILGVIQQGEASRLILDCKAGKVVEPGQVEGVAELLRDFYMLWSTRELAAWQHHPLAASYERREQARVLATLLQEMTNGQQSDRQTSARHGAIAGS